MNISDRFPHGRRERDFHYKNPASPNLLHHNNANGNHSIKFRLIGTHSNRAAIGVKVRLPSIETSTALTNRNNANLTAAVTNQHCAVTLPALGATSDANRFCCACGSEPLDSTGGNKENRELDICP